MIKVIKVLVLFGIINFISSCASIIHSETKENTDFSKFNKIAVIAFNSESQNISGQQLADLISMRFLRKGYQIIERSQLKTIIDEKILASSGLTESQKKELKVYGVDAVVTGSFLSNKITIPLPGPQEINIPIYEYNHILSLKMLNAQTGEVLWIANGNQTEQGQQINSYKMMQKLFDELEKKIPETKAKKFLFFF